VDAELSPDGATNFFRPVSASEDALYDEGGLFIATYEKPPPLGAEVRVSLRFPKGQACEFSGKVAWVRDHMGDEAPAGYGVRFDELPAEARSLIVAYTTAREPLLCD
jgi:Tfp pilus assembly protein PilZ